MITLRKGPDLGPTGERQWLVDWIDMDDAFRRRSFRLLEEAVACMVEVTISRRPRPIPGKEATDGAG